MSDPVVRVSHLVSGDAWGGLEAMVLDLLCSEVYKARVHATLIVLNEGGLASKARARGLHVVVVPESMPLLSLFRELKRAIDDLKPNIVHTHRYKEILLGALLSRAGAPRHVVTIHGYEPPTGFLAQWRAMLGNSLCIGTALLRGGRFVVVAEHLRKRFMIPRNRCVTIGNGVRLPSSETAGFSRDSRPRSGAPVIGWVGRMVPVKGLPTLLKAVAEMKLTPSPTLLLIGDGPERDSLEDLAKRLGIHERVRFQGFVEDAWPYYEQMDVFALPSHQEGIPMALLEALGSGLPVVASEVGGIPHVMGAESVGVLIDSSSPTAWARSLSVLLSDRSRMRAIGERARKHVEANFSIEAMASRYVAMYGLMNTP